MDSVTLARLRAAGAPVAPLETATRRLIRSRTGKVWHRDPAQGPHRGGYSTCGTGKNISGKPGSVAAIMTFAEIAEADIELCSSTGCPESSTAADIHRELCHALQYAERFDAAAQIGDWIDARASVHWLERSADVEDYLRWNPPDNATADDVRALSAWIRTLHAQREPLVTQALAGFKGRVMRAAAASEVQLDRTLLQALGLDWATGERALEAWRSGTQRLNPHVAVHDEVAKAIVLALRSWGPSSDAETQAADHVIGRLITSWDTAADTHPDVNATPSVAVVGRQVELGHTEPATVAGWRSVAALSFPTVNAKDGTATLVPPIVADRIREAHVSEFLKSHARNPTWTFRPDIAVVNGVDAEAFAVIAETALGLWEKEYGSTGPLTSPAEAWKAAVALCA